MRILLDANAVLKRYVTEPGSDAIEDVYRAADAGRIELVYSLWTPGECLGVLDRLERQGRLPVGGLAKGRRALLGESARLARLGVLTVVPVGARLVRKAWSLLLRHHLDQADAVQVATGLSLKVAAVLTSDSDVGLAAAAEGLRALDPERQGAEITEALASWAKA
jgi:predicted nucleic acid-binding protein